MILLCLVASEVLLSNSVPSGGDSDREIVVFFAITSSFDSGLVTLGTRTSRV